jgi:hypothetical protein
VRAAAVRAGGTCSTVAPASDKPAARKRRRLIEVYSRFRTVPSFLAYFAWNEEIIPAPLGVERIASEEIIRFRPAIRDHRR